MREKTRNRKRGAGRSSHWLWADYSDRSWMVRLAMGQLRVLYFIVRGFVDHQCLLRASALTFVTLLSLVPLIALVVSVGRGFGVDQVVTATPGAGAKPEGSAGTDSRTSPTAARLPEDTSTTPSVAPNNAITTGTAAPGDRATTPSAGVREARRPHILVNPDEVGGKAFWVLLRDALTAQLTADQEEVWNRIVVSVERTDFATLHAVGILFLVLTAIMAVGTMEDVFNEIWGVRRARSLLRKFTDYISVVVFCPLFLIAATAITTMVSIDPVVKWLQEAGIYNQARWWFFALAPYGFVWAALTFLYAFLPNTRVKLRYALVGGFAAGCVWQLAFWGYTSFQVGMTRYNAIYSTLAALPFFLTWLYVSWLIVLFGAEVAAGYQNIEAYARQQAVHDVSAGERLQLGLNLVLVICVRFRREQTPWNADQLSRYLECPPRLVDELIEDLTEANIVMPSGKKRMPAYIPAVPLPNITPARIVEALQESGAAGAVGNATPEALCARTLMEQWRAGLWRELGEVGFDVLSDEVQPVAARPPKEKPCKS